MRDEMARHGAPECRLTVLPLFSTLRSDAGPSGEPDTVLFAGRMTPLRVVMFSSPPRRALRA